MPVIVLRLLESQSILTNRPNHCPYCGSEVFQRWGGAISKRVQDINDQTVAVFRYHCSACGRTFRNYPQGIDRTNLTEKIRKLAALTWALGMSTREVVGIFSELGFELSHMTVWRDGHELISKYFNFNNPDYPSRYMIDKLFFKNRGKGIGISVILDLGKGKNVVLGKVDEPNPRVLLSWLETFVQDLDMQALILGTDFLDQNKVP